MDRAYLVLYLFLFVWTVIVMQRYGIGRTFAWCLLPAVLLVNFAQSVPMPLLPNLTSLSMVLYGVCVGLVFRWHELAKIRWNWLDTMVVLMLVPVFVTTMMTADLKLAQRQTMEFGVTWLFPYVMARIALQDADARLWALKTVCVLSIFIGFLAAVESSGFRPNVTARALGYFNLNTTTNARETSMVFKRFGLARAIGPAGQQIDLGNVGVLVGTMILILIPATGSKWTSPLHAGGILGAGAMVVGSVSMTSWAALFIAFVAFGLLTRPGIGRHFVILILLAEVGFMLLTSSSMINQPPVGERPGTDVGDSQWIRIKIMQDAWPMVSSSGWFGYGAALDITAVGVGSVDNAYLLFVMQTGWFSLFVWLALMIVIALKATAALSRAYTDSERLPLAASIAGVLAILFAMYTVFFGFVYAILFACVLGMLSTMCQLLARQRPATVSLQGGMPPAYGMMAGGAR